MLQWVFYVLTVSALLAGAAWLAEHALRTRLNATRWTWAVAMGLSVLLSVLALVHSPQAPAGRGSGMQHLLGFQRIVPLPLPRLLAVPATATAQTRQLRWSRDILELWLGLSVLVLAGLLASAVLLYWHRRLWELRLLGTRCVGMTRDVGPAVVGLLHPLIVVPGWVLERSSEEQQIILAHETSHLQAKDPLLLTCALMALLLLPWNPILWWTLHRLRHAIEVDCDARVLGAGHSTVASYGQALIEVGQRRSRFIGPVAAMSESRTLLEKRIEIMSSRLHRPIRYGAEFVACCLLSVSAAFAATQVSSPATSGTQTEIAVDAATLDRYVGDYKGPGPVLLMITRQGTQLMAQITGQPSLPLYASAPTEFFLKVVNAQVTFVVPESGPATSAVLHQNGRDIVWNRVDETTAQTIKQALAERIANQQPAPGSQEALHKAIDALYAGAPDYADMVPALQEATRKQLPVIQPTLAKLGPAEGIEFKGVADSGADKYVVTHQSGKQTQWVISLGPDGKIMGLGFTPVF